MNSRFTNLFLSFLFLIIISLLSYGGCDIEFGGGGGGNGDSDFETVKGTVTSIIPTSITIEGTFVVVNNDNNASQVLDDTGFFLIEGTFSGSSVQLQFRQQQDPPSFANTGLTIFRGATIELGNITIENGVVDIDQTITNFDATVRENNCTGNSGTLEVETRDINPMVIVTVSISASTQIVDSNNNNRTCEDIGTSVNVRGTLQSGPNVSAIRIEI